MLASAPVLGVAAGWILGGRLAALVDLRVRWWPLLALGIAVRLAAPAAGDLAAALYIAAFAAILTVAVVNVRLPGIGLIAAGAALNLAVVAANGAMPVDAAAVAAADARMPEDRLHADLTDTSRFAILADRIPVPLVRGVYSLGDVLLAAGGFWLPFAAMRRR